MSKNYNKYYNNNRNNDNVQKFNTVEPEETTELVESEEVLEDTVVDSIPDSEDVVENTDDGVDVPQFFYGINNCKKLNVRTEPNKEGDLVCVLDSTNKFQIEELESDPEWVKVFLENGEVGFCMKMYVAIR